jgi:pimeloyl-ACP methyl ester carboxylesterase
MHPVVRSILGIIVGVALAMFLIVGIEYLAHVLFPPPAGLDPNNADDLAQILAQMPAPGFLVIGIAWGLGAFVGGWGAARVARRAPETHIAIIAAVVLVGAIWNMLRIPHPVWFWVVAIALILLGALGARRMDARTRQVPVAP